MKTKKVLPLILLLFVALMIWGKKDSRMVVSKKSRLPVVVNCPKLYGQHKKESQGRKY